MMKKRREKRIRGRKMKSERVQQEKTRKYIDGTTYVLTFLSTRARGKKLLSFFPSYRKRKVFRSRVIKKKQVFQGKRTDLIWKKSQCSERCSFQEIVINIGKKSGLIGKS